LQESLAKGRVEVVLEGEQLLHLLQHLGRLPGSGLLLERLEARQDLAGAG